MTYLRQYLEQMDGFTRPMLPPGFAYTPEGYLLQHGREYTSDPLTDDELDTLYTAMDACRCKWPVKRCYRNSQLLLLSRVPSLFEYVEGMVYRAGLIPLDHAWLTLNGKVIDLTLRVSLGKRSRSGSHRLRNRAAVGMFYEPVEYYGVTFPTDDVRCMIVETGVHGALLRDYKRGHPLLRGIASAAGER